MSYLSAQSAVIALFDTQWAGETEVAWPNVAFDQTAHSEFVNFSYEEVSDNRITVDSSAVDNRKFGIIIVQVFTELESGAARSAELVDRVTGIFRNRTIASERMVFRDATIVQVGQNDGFYQENVEIETYRNEQH